MSLSRAEVEQAVDVASRLVHAVAALAQTISCGSEESAEWLSAFGRQLAEVRAAASDLGALSMHSLAPAFAAHARTTSICGISGSNALEIIERLGRDVLGRVNSVRGVVRQILRAAAEAAGATPPDEESAEFLAELLRRLREHSRTPDPPLDAYRQFAAVLEQEAGGLLLDRLQEEPTPAGKLEQALAKLAMHPEWSDRKIAQEVGCSGPYLSKQPKWRAARAAIKGVGQEDKHRAAKHHGHDMDQYPDDAEDRYSTGQSPVPKCLCGDQAETDATGKPLMHEGKPRCRECWDELRTR
jgi:hypothetical protein